MKLIYMGTPDFAVPALEELYKAGFEISLVVSQEDKRRGRGKKLQPTAVKAKALDLGIEVFQPESINSDKAYEKLSSLEPDVIVVTAYGQILSERILKLPKYGCLNIHASLLPKYRGAAPINRAIMDGEDYSGITIMEMEKGLDTGDILLQEKMAIEEDFNAEDLHDKLSLLGARLIVETLENIDSLKENKLKQDDSEASYAEKIFKDTGLINWEEEGLKIYNKIRGLQSWPGAFTFYGDKNIKLGKVNIIRDKEKYNPGLVTKVSEEGIFVDSLDSSLILREIQFPGKRMMKVEDFLKGNEFEEGIFLG